jgi:hypothetical protein
MDTKKYVIAGFLIFVLFVIAIFTSCGGNNMQSKKMLNNFSIIIESGNLDTLSLTIYYISPSILTRHPISVNDLMDYSGVNKIVINGSDLEEHIDLLNQLSNTALIPVKSKSYLDARLYYLFETKEEGAIFDVAIGVSDGKSMFVNGTKVKGNDIFIDVLIPFLTEDAVKELGVYLVRDNHD